MSPLRVFTSWVARLWAIHTRNSLPLAPQPFLRPVKIDNQNGILCRARPQTLDLALFPFFSLEHCPARHPQFSCFLPHSKQFHTPNSRQLIRLQPLCALFTTSVLCFQWLAASFAKKGGV